MDNDLDLLNKARSGDRDAFTALVLLHQGRVRAYLGRFVRIPDIVDDLAQDVFLSAYRTLNTFKDEAPLDIWLLGIARHRALEYLRAESRRHARLANHLESVLHDWHARSLESEVSEKAADVEALRECLKSLPENSNRLVREHYFAGRTSAELARACGRSEAAVRMTLLRIRQSLRQCVQQRAAGSA